MRRFARRLEMWNAKILRVALSSAAAARRDAFLPIQRLRRIFSKTARCPSGLLASLNKNVLGAMGKVNGQVFE